MTQEETVLTTRRALLRTGRTWSAGRLRVTDRVVRFTPHDGEVLEVPVAEVAAVRVVGRPRRALLLETPAGPVRLRCFAVAAVAGLIPI